MAFCPLVHYSSDSSLEVDQPETVELQSDQEPTPETQHSAAVRASSSPNRDSPGQEAHQSDSAHQQPSIPVSATNRRNPYALELSQLPAHLRTFLNSVKTYFTQKFNLQRQKAPLSPSTYDKAQERMLCKYSVVKDCSGFVFLVRFGQLSPASFRVFGMQRRRVAQTDLFRVRFSTNFS